MTRQNWNVIWDLPDDVDGNVHHVREHGLDEGEVEDVLLDRSLPIEISASSGHFLRRGYTLTGRYIVVIWEQVDDEAVRPITAYEPS